MTSLNLFLTRYYDNYRFIMKDLERKRKCQLNHKRACLLLLEGNNRNIKQTKSENKTKVVENQIKIPLKIIEEIKIEPKKSEIEMKPKCETPSILIQDTKPKKPKKTVRFQDMPHNPENDKKEEEKKQENERSKTPSSTFKQTSIPEELMFKAFSIKK